MWYVVGGEGSRRYVCWGAFGMSRRVDLPPQGPPEPDGTRVAGWWHDSPDGRRLVCDLCPRGCALGPGDRGFCFVRQNRDGRIVSTTYGRSTGFCIDPIEKKPLNHFYPGTSVLSFGTAGCNLGCKFCQNWSMSKSRQVDVAGQAAAPDDIARTALEWKCRSVAFTYNDPIVWAEYAIDTARACRERGIKTVAVTNGYISAAARRAFFEAMDAANVDLKGFTEDFYWKLSGGHLQPVLDTFRWLIHESAVWVEITNLVIPRANDSAHQLARMCDWIVEELGPDVPVHFTAFHPDFRLTDRGPTPPGTLAMAHEVARRAGVRYAYTGNVSDREHQSTYCPGCGRLLIERDGYDLGVYALRGGCCGVCGARIAGHFDAAPGTWGSRRQPVRIVPAEPRTNRGEPKGGTKMASRRPQPPPGRIVPDRPQLSEEQEGRVFSAVAQRVAAAVRSRPAQPLEELLVDVAGMPVFGAFVSLKRAGQLRSCCGYLGQSVPMHEALDQAALRAAKEDPRFPPISPAELEHLEMEVWLLWGMEPVTAQGRERVQAVTIGKHGLQIARGHQRGLLLPGVAVDHHLDAEGFLRQVCLKAGLPPEAWKEEDTALSTFEGYAIHGRLGPSLLAAPEEPAAGGPAPDDLRALAEFCRRNLIALAQGATPSYYLPGGYDGDVSGAVISVHLPGLEEAVDCSRLSLRPEMPLQATLLELVDAAAGVVCSVPLTPETLSQVSCGLTILWDPAMQGRLPQPDLAGVDSKRRAVMVAGQSRWALAFDPGKSPEDLLDEALRRAGMSESPSGTVYSLAVASSEPRAVASNVPRPQPGPAVRPPAVAGRFYPGKPAEVDRLLAEMLPPPGQRGRWAGAMVPHAGWVYSGRLAAATLSRVDFPPQVIVFSPKHHPGGADWAVAPYQAWALPGGQVPGDPELARQLAEGVAGLALDAEAHRMEHAIEVLLPLLARLAPRSRVVGIALHGGDLPRLERGAEQLAGVLGGLPERPLLVISSDMNHYADDQQTRRLDRMALDALESLDPARLYETVTTNRISMCGILPAVLVLATLRRLGALNRCEAVGYATSADASGDRSHVVGYAGMLFA